MYQFKRMLPLLGVAVIGYLLFANWKLEETQALARATACSSGGCPDAAPASVSHDPFKHRYAWTSGAGQLEVTCRRGLILMGAWTCKLDREPPKGVEGRDDMGQYPHQTQRGVD